MPRQKKDNTPLNIRMDKAVSERLIDYCEETGISKTAAVERAVLMYVEDYNNKKDMINKLKSKKA